MRELRLKSGDAKWATGQSRGTQNQSVASIPLRGFLLGALLGDDEPLPTTQASQQGECLPLQSPKTLVVGRGTHEPLGGGNGGPQGRRR